MRAVVAGVVLAGGLVVVTGGTAEAATRCAVGSWKAVSYSAKDVGAYTATVKGYAGTRLTVGKTGRLTWNFAHSKVGRFRVTSSTVEGVVSNDLALARTLKFRGKLTGAKKGTLKAVPKSASGNALLSIHFVGGTSSTTESLVPIAKQARTPEFYGGSYSCTGKKLRVTHFARFIVDGKAVTRSLVRSLRLPGFFRAQTLSSFPVLMSATNEFHSIGENDRAGLLGFLESRKSLARGTTATSTQEPSSALRLSCAR
jgi:hypothetical protein